MTERPSVSPGDVLLFENRTWHAGGVNTSGRTRKCVMMQYAYRWVKPIDYVEHPPSLMLMTIGTYYEMVSPLP